MDPQPISVRSSREAMQLPIILPPTTITDVPLRPFTYMKPRDVDSPDWETGEEAERWFLGLREAVKSVVYRSCWMIEQAKGIFEETKKVHHKNYQRLEDAVEGVWYFWRGFNAQPELTVEFLSWQKSLYDVVKSVAGYMRSPMSIRKKYKQRMKEVRTETKVIVDEAAKLSTLIGESADRLDIYQRDYSTSENVTQHQEDDQESPPAQSTTILHLKGEGFQQLSECLVAGKTEHLTQLRKLEVEANWEVPQAMTRYRQPQDFGPITTTSGGQTDAQAATVSN